jgi:hypothetical protein
MSLSMHARAGLREVTIVDIGISKSGISPDQTSSQVIASNLLSLELNLHYDQHPFARACHNV